MTSSDLQTIEIVELFEYGLWERRRLPVPRDVAEAESQDRFIKWFYANLSIPVDVCALYVWSFKPGAAEAHEENVDEDDPYDREVIERARALGVCQGCGTDILAEGGANEDCEHPSGCGVMHGPARR
jgi:hypothetical protein